MATKNEADPAKNEAPVPIARAAEKLHMSESALVHLLIAHHQDVHVLFSGDILIDSTTQRIRREVFVAVMETQPPAIPFVYCDGGGAKGNASRKVACSDVRLIKIVRGYRETWETACKDGWPRSYLEGSFTLATYASSLRQLSEAIKYQERELDEIAQLQWGGHRSNLEEEGPHKRKSARSRVDATFAGIVAALLKKGRMLEESAAEVGRYVSREAPTLVPGKPRTDKQYAIYIAAVMDIISAKKAKEKNRS